MRTIFRNASVLLACLALAACGDDGDPMDGRDAGPTPTVDANTPPVDAAPMCSEGGEENTAAACMDGCDNEGDGFADCNDRDCCNLVACGPDTYCGSRTDGGPNPMEPTTVTIAQLQNRADIDHPAPGTRISVTESGLVALTPRLLVGSASGGSTGVCRFAVWVGHAAGGDFSAIQVQELINLTDGIDSCYRLPVGRISDQFAPGDAVTAIENATYNEFCAAASGSTPVPCTEYEQSNIFLGGSATITRGAAGAVPTPTTVSIADIGGTAAGPGARTIPLEGTLLRVENVAIRGVPDGSFVRYSAFEGTNEIDIQVTNFPRTACARDELARLAADSGATATITGILVPNFGRWQLRLRDEADIAGLTCESAAD